MESSKLQQQGKPVSTLPLWSVTSHAKTMVRGKEGKHMPLIATAFASSRQAACRRQGRA